MSIKPVDFQVMIPRSMEAAKISNDANHKNLTYQQQQAAATQHRAEGSLKQVYSRAQPQSAHVDDKQKESNKKDKKGKRLVSQSSGNDENDHGRPVNEIITSTIDIKI
jgi:hypothetical protein